MDYVSFLYWLKILSERAQTKFSLWLSSRCYLISKLFSLLVEMNIPHAHV